MTDDSLITWDTHEMTLPQGRISVVVETTREEVYAVNEWRKTLGRDTQLWESTVLGVTSVHCTYTEEGRNVTIRARVDS